MESNPQSRYNGASTQIGQYPLLRPLRRMQPYPRWIAGVCCGLALHLGLPVMVVRALVIATFFIGGAGIMVYLLLWLVIPSGDPIAVRDWQVASDSGRLARPLVRPTNDLYREGRGDRYRWRGGAYGPSAGTYGPSDTYRNNNSYWQASAFGQTDVAQQVAPSLQDGPWSGQSAQQSGQQSAQLDEETGTAAPGAVTMAAAQSAPAALDTQEHFCPDTVPAWPTRAAKNTNNLAPTGNYRADNSTNPNLVADPGLIIEPIPPSLFAQPVPPVQPAASFPNTSAPSLRRRYFLLIGGAILALSGLLILAQMGLVTLPGWLWPVLVMGAGIGLVWGQIGENAWRKKRSFFFMVGSGLLVLLCGILLALTPGSIASALRGVVIGMTFLLGSIVAVTPLGLRLLRDLGDSQATQARESERADIAAHLHDSVLQTLALIRSQSDDSEAVARLARTQERELRLWLYGNPRADETDLNAAIKAQIGQLEDTYGTTVEVVTVGQAQLNEQIEVLPAIIREAVTNALKHAQPPVTVYVEATDTQVMAFIRDRGPGFDLDNIPADRHGVRESIIDRAQRVGGSVTIRRLVQGSEVCVCLPRSGAGLSGLMKGNSNG